MRTLKLSHKEVEIITKSLTNTYNLITEIADNNKEIVGSNFSNKIISEADKYFELLCEITEGKKDI